MKIDTEKAYNGFATIYFARDFLGIDKLAPEDYEEEFVDALKNNKVINLDLKKEWQDKVKKSYRW